MTQDPRPGQPADPLNVAVGLAPADLSSDLGETPRRSSARRATTTFADGEEGDMQLVADVEPHELMKLRLLVTAAVIVAGIVAAGTLPGPGALTSSSPHQAAAPAVPVAALAEADPVTNPRAELSLETASDKPVGALIKTDIAHSGGKLTLWFSESATNEGRLQLSLGAQDAKGGLRSFGSALASSRRPAGVGFEAGYDAVNGDSEPRAYALIGIVVGNVSRVTLTVDGKPRTASTAPWSADPRVHAWWVLGDKLDRWPAKSQPIKGTVSNLTAYGPDGKVIARGDDGEVAHG